MEDLVIKATKQKKIGGEVYISFSKDEYWKWLDQFEDGHELLITISSKRSLGQNALLHKCIAIIADYMGEDFDIVKHYLVCRFFGYKETEMEGVVYKVPVSTSRLSKKDFASGLTKLYIFAQEENIKLPETDIISQVFK